METARETYSQEFSVSEILSISWEIYWRFCKELFPLAFVVYMPMNIFLTFFPIGNISEFEPDSYTSWWGIFGVMNIAVYLSFFGNIALSIAINEMLNHRKIKFRLIINQIYLKFKNNFANNLLMLAIVFICFNIWMLCFGIYPVLFVVLLIPILFYLINWSFTIYVFSFTDLNLYNSMRYSYRLVSKRWIKVFNKVVLLVLFSLATSMIIGLPYSYLHDAFYIKILYSNLVSVVNSFYVVSFIVFYLNFDESKL